MLYFLALVILLISNINANKSRPDLTVVGNMQYADGLDRLAISFIDSLYKDLDINFVAPSYTSLNGVPNHVVNIVNNSKNYSNPNGKVAFFLTNPTHKYSNAIKKLPKSDIKIAYSMLESTRIPNEWTAIFNKQFDAVAVPDKWLIDVYKNCGVTVPIFELPHSIELQHFLNYKKKFRSEKSHKPFIFGCSAVFSDSKNQTQLIKAFNAAFGNNPNFRLVLHGRRGDAKPLMDLIRELKLRNVTIMRKVLNKQAYLQMMSSFDCYVLLSKGEGFSVTPRESLALGIPTIITNNTAHKTICDTGFVIPVKSDRRQNAYYHKFDGPMGHKFDCSFYEASLALKEVYKNYDHYVQKAAQGKEWVKQYLPENLKPKFLALLNPKKIIQDSNNKIVNNILHCSDKNLINKYNSLIGN